MLKQNISIKKPSQETINQLINLYKQGQFLSAAEQAQILIKQFPNEFVFWNILGAANKGLGQVEKASEAFKKVTELKPNYADGFNNLGIILKNEGKFEEAIEAYKKAISIKPDSATIYVNLAIALENQGEIEEAIKNYNKALLIKPDNHETYNHIGNAFIKAGKLDAAIDAYDKALSLSPNYAEAYNNIGVVYENQGKLSEAKKAYDKAIHIKPDFAEAYNNLGNILKNNNDLKIALNMFKKAISFKPNYAEAYHNMGVILQEQTRHKEAISAFSKSLTLKPDNEDAQFNIGVILHEQGKYDEAVEAYKNALALNPNFAKTYNNIGVVLHDQGKLEEALVSYNKSISIKPDYFEAYYNMGNTFQKQRRLDLSIKAYKHSLSIEPNNELARAHKLHQQAYICDWNSIFNERKLIPFLGMKHKFVPPFTMLSFEDDPESHKIRSRNYSENNFLQSSSYVQEIPSKKSKRIRIGYFSAEFHNHATMILMAKIFDMHDKHRFQIYAYSYGPNVNDFMRKKIINSVDVFDDVSEMSDKEIAMLARQDEIDIAVDLKGFTENNRLGIFAFRPAPIQITYLGYPGTTGTNFIDYIIADPTVIPTNLESAYSEKIIYLPNTYQPNDNTRPISAKFSTRKDEGLPEKGFVFCCFNNNYKISSTEFDIWMRLLNKVQGSVLWLLKSNQWAEKNLQKEAEKRGVQKNRLVFASKVPHSEHLARHEHADLFIDTFNVNAHTTTSDALWTSLPVVTKLGQGFASRVAGSLLNAIGMPELITKSNKEYEALIFELATNPEKLNNLKEKLIANRLSKPLFNTELYTQHLEDGYQEAYQNYFEGNSPQNIFVSN